jgi:hypothetical protein
MGFYAPYKPEQRSLWLIAFRTILGSQKDVVRLIAKKYLFHWFESEIDFSFSVDCGRIYMEQERNILNKTNLTMVHTNVDVVDFVSNVCIANMKSKINILLFCKKRSTYASKIAKAFDPSVIEKSNWTELKLINSGSLRLMTLQQDCKTTRGISVDMFIVEDFDDLNASLFYTFIMPSLMLLSETKLLCFYQRHCQRIEYVLKNKRFDFMKF